MWDNREAVLERLLEEHYVRAYHYAKTLTRNEEDAKDLVQDVYVAIWQARDKYDTNKIRSFWFYLRRVLLNKHYDHQRRAKACGKQEWVELEKLVDKHDPTDLVDHVDAVMKVDAIVKQLDTLDAETSQMMHLYLNGCNYDEIAQKMRRNKNTVKTRIHRVKQRLLRQQRELLRTALV